MTSVSPLSSSLLLARNRTAEAKLRDSIVAIARSQLGKRYVWGSDSPARGGFDCSGLVKFVLSMFRLDLPRTANSQSLVGRAVAKDTARLRPGDLLIFGGSQRVTHIGIYVGNGKVVHASSSRHEVVESKLTQDGSWFSGHWVGVRRLVATTRAEE